MKETPAIRSRPSTLDVSAMVAAALARERHVIDAAVARCDTHRDDVTLPALVVALVAGTGYVALVGTLFLSWAVGQ